MSEPGPDRNLDPTELALAFIDRFAAGDLDSLRWLLAEDLLFEGPLLSCSSREEYLGVLQEDALEPREYRIDSVSTADGEVSVWADYDPAETPLRVAHRFVIEGGLIAGIELLFDTADLVEG